MPCRCDDYNDYITSNERAQYEQRIADIKKELDKVTRLFCETLTNTMAKGDSLPLTDEAVKWWKSHQASDERRRKQEQAVAEALRLKEERLKKAELEKERKEYERLKKKFE